jgi:hypothetical protein
MPGKAKKRSRQQMSVSDDEEGYDELPPLKRQKRSSASLASGKNFRRGIASPRGKDRKVNYGSKDVMDVAAQLLRPRPPLPTVKKKDWLRIYETQQKQPINGYVFFTFSMFLTAVSHKNCETGLNLTEFSGSKRNRKLQ